MDPRLDLPRIDVIVEPAGTDVRIIDVHTVPPVSRAYVRMQDRMSRELASVAREASQPLILAGDFNSPETGVPVRGVMREGLQSVHRARGRGLGATWPREGAFRDLLRTRIDQILFSPDLECTGTGVLGDTGSDHRPVWARFRLVGPAS